ncbi:HAD family hydrolase [Promethearchaeum syntrophicum]|uniref:HAD family hydrolase n=1 Tax=Promethearchaeum syntrophicum TaxID=2594042 RepID=A0A5B9DAF5_9ARCH|nr:HAD hydrolase-like protein [Candidatus Prometheoarchaeum syntrophicum]QEE15576.1 Phosphoglycolate phosphatase [Candidatus Prometheoarchaeum syntrophicum]
MNKEICIIWDWNGTLIDDVHTSLECINIILKKHQLATINRENYQQIFTFPVEQYYRKLGFDFTKISFAKLADEFIHEYKKRMLDAKLYPNVKDVLEHLQQMGVKQFVISAMEIGKLKLCIENKGISHYFEDILGLNNNYANGKMSLVKEFARQRKDLLYSSNIWMIGDTEHDFYIASELKWNSILVSQGHHSYSRLSAVGNIVLRNLNDIKKIFSNII